jgi:AraC-like DNA-binding protein
MTDLPLFRVAERVGLSTPVRLSRLLKAETGMTAKEIRKQKETSVM